MVKPWVAEVFKENPDINEIILYEDRFNSTTGKFKLAKKLKTEGFDTAILLQNAFDAAFITWLSGIPQRIGYSTDYRRLLLTKAIPLREAEHRTQNTEHRQKHHVYYYLNLLKEALDIKTEDIEPSIYLNDEEINWARTLINSKFKIQNSKFVIGINPGATYGSAKRWLSERFAELIQRIINELNGGVILFGSGSEVGIVEKILKAVHSLQFTAHGSQNTDNPPLPPFVKGGMGGILNVAGKTTLRELMALISECDAFITNDSGPMHIASAFHVPIVAIFGSTDKTVTAPIGKGHKIVSKDIPCSPCLQRECPEGHLKCMTDITTGDVFSALLEILPEHKAVFLDRDGTLIEDVGYLNDFSNLKIFQGASENLQRLKKTGFKLIGVTNQSGIERGLINEDFVKESNTYLKKTLGIDAFYYCPHHPNKRCQCRKPRPMLLHKARLEHRINLKASYVIGDKTLDVLLAKTVGAKSILVLTGHDRESRDADFIAKDLTFAVDWILEQEKITSS